MKQILSKYLNGNVWVTLFEDGTQVLEYDDIPEYKFPTSMDVKITNWCNLNCKQCHESSTDKGKHGDLNKLSKILSVLPGGQELAIGGGACQTHPDFIEFLKRCKKQNLICNITINQQHLISDYFLLRRLIDEKLIYGIGISINNANTWFEDDLWFAKYEHSVAHLILGVHTIESIKILQLMGFKKFLLLGYKEFGRGIKYYNKNKENIESNIKEWKDNVPKLFGSSIISFDNLAISQLDIQSMIPEKIWNQCYMGEDFNHTMYVDAVEQIFAPTSRNPKSDRVKWNKISLLDYFQTYRNK